MSNFGRMTREWPSRLNKKLEGVKIVHRIWVFSSSMVFILEIDLERLLGEEWAAANIFPKEAFPGESL